MHVMLLKKMPASLAEKVEAIKDTLFDRLSLDQGVVPIAAIGVMIATCLRAKASARPAAASCLGVKG